MKGACRHKTLSLTLPCQGIEIRVFGFDFRCSNHWATSPIAQSHVATSPEHFWYICWTTLPLLLSFLSLLIYYKSKTFSRNYIMELGLISNCIERLFHYKTTLSSLDVPMKTVLLQFSSRRYLTLSVQKSPYILYVLHPISKAFPQIVVFIPSEHKTARV